MSHQQEGNEKLHYASQALLHSKFELQGRRLEITDYFYRGKQDNTNQDQFK